MDLATEHAPARPREAPSAPARPRASRLARARSRRVFLARSPSGFRTRVRSRTAILALIGSLLLLGAIACGDDPVRPADRVPAELVPVGGDARTGVVGTAVEVPPSVVVLDADGLPVPGVEIVFRVAEGGGTIAGAVQRTDAEGEARVGGWILGAMPGIQRLIAEAEGLEPAVLLATARVGAPRELILEARPPDSAVAGSAADPPPRIAVVDGLGNPVPGVAVGFEVLSGGGSVEPARVVTDSDGIAAPTAWLLGSEAGRNVLEASVDGVGALTVAVEGVAGSPAAVVAVQGDDQQGEPGEVLSMAPAVRVEDALGNPVSGVDVAYSVAEGDGSVTPAVVSTDSLGVAAADSWTLGTRPGENVVLATVDGLDPVAFNATVVPAGRESVKVAGDRQGAPAASPVPVDPAVQVVDGLGDPVPGVPVRFAVESGGGSVTGAVTTTGPDGVATVGSWILGPDLGQNYLRAWAEGTEPVYFRATAVDPVRFNLDVRIASGATPEQLQALESARSRWTSVVVGDVPDVQLSIGADACLDGQPAVDEVIDDLVVYVRLAPIDGPGRVLGSAGPCLVRSESSLPVVGVIDLDSEDLERMEVDGILETVVLHEVGHALGIGTIWSTGGLLVGKGGSDPYFAGPAAYDGWVEIGGPSVYSGVPVPVENTGGPGTRDSHWRETVVENELMTGFVDPEPNPLSALTVGSLADLGYEVDPDAADPFTAPEPAPATAPGAEGGAEPDGEGEAPVELEEVPLPPPLEVDEDGRVSPR